jgi:hypothetical protein
MNPVNPYLLDLTGLGADLITEATGLLRDAATPHGMTWALLNALRDLEANWLEEAYEAEREGNAARAHYILGWSNRLRAVTA